MMHLKNITAGNPKTKEQYQLTKQFNIKWLYTEDGKNWYEEQKNFQRSEEHSLNSSHHTKSRMPSSA